MRRARGIALIAATTLTMAGCGTASTSGAGSGQEETATPATPRTEPGLPEAPTVNALGEADLENLTYAGGCGWEAAWQPIGIVDGVQQNPTASYGGQSSTATVTGTEIVDVDGREVALVDMSCTVGEEEYAAVHLIGLVADRPTDLGIVAMGTSAEVTAEGGALRGSETYLSSLTMDETTSTFSVVLAGDTPVRVGDGPEGAAPRFQRVPEWVGDLPAHGYDQGLVAVALPGPATGSDLPQRWVTGVLVDDAHVLVAQNVTGCDGVTVHTAAGEALEVDAAGPAGTGASVLELTEPSSVQPAAGTDALATDEPMLVASTSGRAPSVGVPLTERHRTPAHETAVGSYEWMDHQLDRSNQIDEHSHEPVPSSALVGAAGPAALGVVSYPTKRSFAPARGVVALGGLATAVDSSVCD